MPGVFSCIHPRPRTHRIPNEAHLLYDPQTGTIVDAEGVLLVDLDELETHLDQVPEHYDSVNEALLEEDPAAQAAAQSLGRPIMVGERIQDLRRT